VSRQKLEARAGLVCCARQARSIMSEWTSSRRGRGTARPCRAWVAGQRFGMIVGSGRGRPVCEREQSGRHRNDEEVFADGPGGVVGDICSLFAGVQHDNGRSVVRWPGEDARTGVAPFRR